MKNSNHLPTNVNVYNSIISDPINRNKYIEKFISLLGEFEDNSVISLDGEWGSGKTFFVKAVKMVLDAFNPDITYKDNQLTTSQKESICSKFKNINPNKHGTFVTVYYDAWENDNDYDPILSVIYTISQSIESDESFVNNPNILLIACSIMSLVTGKNFNGFKDELKQKSMLEGIKSSKELYYQIKDYLNSLLPEHGNRMIIFVDELDRCRPTYAIELLERIKHYFTDDRITFIFSVNLEQLQYTINNSYGYGFDGYKYLDRFFDLKINIPKVDTEMYCKILDHQQTSYLYDKVTTILMDIYDFSLREKQRFIQSIKLSGYKIAHNGNYFETTDRFCINIVLPLLIALKTSNITEYRDFKNGVNPKPLLEFYSHPYVKDNKKWFFINNMLNSNEAFELDVYKTVIIDYEKRIEEVYNAIFNYNYDIQNSFQKIGDMEFDRKTAIFVFELEDLMSDYTDFLI